MMGALVEAVQEVWAYLDISCELPDLITAPAAQ
jgi:hypothetical protein